MIITDLGSRIRLTFDTGDVTYAKDEIIGTSSNNKQETYKLKLAAGGTHGKTVTVIDYADITSPVYGTFAEFVTWMSNILDDSVTTILHIATATDEANGYIDLTAYASSLTVNMVTQGSAVLNPSQYSYSSTTHRLTFVGGITDGDYILVYVNL